ncbi:hypothetical protein Q4E93_20520 [Flavitalea sp. BT771]|uniref:hypothetical protein n=1 Tax=Flavitalea sp. BT771 TaxID=3063329 RepID=UPI0026E22E8B|nr:hypothetical protein [Flavitalea sp. BT771]MDO6433004.1 hypothetical protein [Flavitalea sp. BT771]MDV6221720.1 hypothetical protein [Flavitalea sp. BT771]
MAEVSLEFYRRLSKKLLIVIAILLVLLGISIYYLYRKEALLYSVVHKPSFVDPVDPATAYKMVKNYRDIPSFPVTTKRSYGVYYTKEEILHYVNVTYDSVTNLYTLPDHCTWVVGFYFMKKIDSVTHKRMDFLVIPAAYDTIDHIVYDYIDSAHRYRRTNSAQDPVNLTPNTIPGYDAGHLWP